MLAMQYSIQLPANVDKAMIENRVAARKSLFDSHGGLVHKSFLYNEEEQIYAPFYVWKDVQEAQRFLLDNLFKGVIETFTRQRVRSWFVLHMAFGNRNIQPGFAWREVDIIAPEEPLDKFLKDEKAAQDDLLKDKNLFMHLVALDADRWELLRFGLWKDRDSAAKPYGDAVMGYDVLHISQPA